MEKKNEKKNYHINSASGIMKYIHFIISAIFIFNFIYCQNTYGISLENTIILPENPQQEIPENGKFKISIDLRDENNDYICIDMDDILFGAINCFLNGTLPLHKYMDLDGNIVCIHQCGFHPISGTTIDVKVHDTLMKSYMIGSFSGTWDRSKDNISTYSPSSAGSIPYIKLRTYDVYGLPYYIENENHYSRFKCTVNGINGNKIPKTNGLQCEPKNPQYEIEGSYSLKMDYTHENNTIENIYTLNYNIYPLNVWSPEKSTVQFPASMLRGNIYYTKVITAKDKYGNVNTHLLLDVAKIYILNSSGETIIKYDNVLGGSNHNYRFLAPYIVPQYVKIKICIGIYCKISDSIYLAM